MTSHGDSTRCVHSGLPAPVVGAPLAPSPVFAANYHLDPEGVTPGADGYGRPDNPTRRLLEASIGELEDGSCLVFSSGQAAITALLMSVLRPGDKVAIPSDGYYAARSLVHSFMEEMGITVTEVPTAGPYPSFDGYKLILVETPANPILDVADIAALGESALRAGALLAVDNTASTPLCQRPLILGADVVVASGTKALTGHEDLLLGYVATRDPQLLGKLQQWRNLGGAIPSAFDCWLARRSLSTLALRLRQQASNGAAIANLLRAIPLVADVRWAATAPGLVSFLLPTAGHVAAFLRASTLVSAATSFGGLHTTADRRNQWGDTVPPGFVRLSCGIEDTPDLVADITAALATLA